MGRIKTCLMSALWKDTHSFVQTRLKCCTHTSTVAFAFVFFCCWWCAAVICPSPPSPLCFPTSFLYPVKQRYYNKDRYWDLSLKDLWTTPCFAYSEDQNKEINNPSQLPFKAAVMTASHPWNVGGQRPSAVSLCCREDLWVAAIRERRLPKGWLCKSCLSSLLLSVNNHNAAFCLEA